MSFKQYLPKEVTLGLDETYTVDAWASELPGKAYFAKHISTIEQLERVTPIFRERLQGRGLRILESGCGTGRWVGYFESLGHVAVGIDDSRGALRVAREHDPAMPLVRADALSGVFRDSCFDAAYSSYVAEHFEDGPGELLRELHRVLKPGGLLFLVVPYNNTFRRWIVNPALRLLNWEWRRKGRALGFTEFRFDRGDLDALLSRTGFVVERVEPDEFLLPWSKGLFVDLSDLGSFFRYEHKPPFEFGRFGRGVVRAIQSLGLWHSCAGIFYVARAQK